MLERSSIRFVIGPREVAAVPRRLVTVRYTLEQLLRADPPALPPAPPGADGVRVLSCPPDQIAALRSAYPNYLTGGVQDYQRRYIDMRGSTYADYLASFSGKTRSTLMRKQRKFASLDGDRLDISEYRTPDELDRFLDEALPLSRRTYQARLLDAGLPEEPAFREQARELGARDGVRAYILRLMGVAVAYLYLPIESETLIYAFLGYDQDHAALSPGTVLQMQALERLFGEQRFSFFDFTEGNGPHKALFGTGAVEAASLFLLKPTPGNRALVGGLNLFNTSVAGVKHIAERAGVTALARRWLRG